MSFADSRADHANRLTVRASADRAGATRSSAGRSARLKYWVDFALLGAWLLAAVPGATGVPIHEWLAVGIVLTLLVHVVMHWDWLSRHLLRVRMRAQNQVHRLLDAAMWVLATTVMLSGFLISEAVLPAVGIDVTQTTLWMRVHALSSMLLLVVLASHVLSHWGWIVTQTRAVLRGGR